MQHYPLSLGLCRNQTDAQAADDVSQGKGEYRRRTT
jgi:hypothetical protein